MATFNLTVQDQEVQRLLDQLIERAGNPKAALAAIGDDIIERVKQRFATSTDPDGNPWKPNSPVTLAIFARGLGKSYRKKSGSLNAKGERAVASKKLLIDTGELEREISSSVSGSTLIVKQSRLFAAIHQFGGQAGRGHKVTIPARPSMPVHQDGTLYQVEQRLIIDALNEFLMDGLD